MKRADAYRAVEFLLAARGRVTDAQAVLTQGGDVRGAMALRHIIDSIEHQLERAKRIERRADDEPTGAA